MFSNLFGFLLVTGGIYGSRKSIVFLQCDDDGTMLQSAQRSAKRQGVKNMSKVRIRVLWMCRGTFWWRILEVISEYKMKREYIRSLSHNMH